MNPYIRFRDIIKLIILEFSDRLDEAETIALGTGRTSEVIMDVLHDLGLLRGKVLTATSYDTLLKLNSIGYNVTSPLSLKTIDIYIDSADFVDRKGNMIKGGGGALTMEKILAFHSKLRIFIVDEGKVTNICPNKPIPVEVLPNALNLVKHYLERQGFKVILRECNCKRGPAISDVGGIIIDVVPPRKACENMERLEYILETIPGIVMCGIFTKKLIDFIYVFNEKSYYVLKEY